MTAMALIALKAYITPETRRKIRVRVAESDDDEMTIGKYLTSLVNAEWEATRSIYSPDENNGGEAA